MKTLFLAAFLLAAGLGSAAAQGQNFRAPINRARAEERSSQRDIPLQRRGVIGALPRAARGNPVQMLNPRAPQKYYAAPQDTVTFDPTNPSRVTGIILVGIVW